jgi:hypothetical protein
MQQDNSALIAALKNERVSKNINVIAEKNSVITEGTEGSMHQFWKN